MILSVLRTSSSFANDLAGAIRPYLICLVKDWIIALCLWSLCGSLRRLLCLCLLMVGQASSSRMSTQLVLY